MFELLAHAQSDGQAIASQILDNEETLFLVVGGAVGIVGIVFGTATAMVKATARERTRREIAAYIAEGAMTPEQGERLMRAGKR
ncbi:MAG: hypothetical protein AAGB51_03445 [Planctomycetota bacterium]